jgi:hypothetical protein
VDVPVCSGKVKILVLIGLHVTVRQEKQPPFPCLTISLALNLLSTSKLDKTTVRDGWLSFKAIYAD